MYKTRAPSDPYRPDVRRPAAERMAMRGHGRGRTELPETGTFPCGGRPKGALARFV